MLDSLRFGVTNNKPVNKTTTLVNVLGDGLLTQNDMKGLETFFNVKATRVISRLSKNEGPYWVVSVEQKEKDKLKAYVDYMKLARKATNKLAATPA